MKNNDKGITLFEIVVSMAILGILSVSVVMFISVSSRNYRKTSTDVNLQYESQLAVNQIKDMVIDSNQSIAYYGMSADNKLVAGLDDNALPLQVDGKIIKKLYVYNTDKAYSITWEQQKQELYYREYEVDAATKSLQPATDEVLMAKHISGFSADLNNLDSDKIVRIRVNLESGDKTYEASHNITLRNDVGANIAENEIYGVTPAAPEADKIKSITVSPEMTYWINGTEGTVEFTAKVEVASGSPSKAVTWSYTASGNSLSLSVNNGNGLLTIGKNPQAGEVKVCATSVIDPTIMGYATVVIGYDVANVLIRKTYPDGNLPDEPFKEDNYPKPQDLNNNNNFKVNQSDTIDLEGKVNFTGMPKETKYQDVAWSITSGAEYACITPDGRLTVNFDAPLYAYITVEALTKFGVGRTRTFTVWPK
ncbi:type II secretion system protein [Anaerobium acetethylicum]|uniref:Type II secretory pathway, component PulJ n=1 Tax=Anaerobium acetethylicum TaxID=1619234 RepID=A0A1D3TN67_9FIRM|nr:prepilin-type N-terminal cleavage/methylation domain-containing protein [Anaerobium acetethylicum]SCP94736.1 Type II secretory pathway, component PulJ [Anaerobium acetethylicum]